MTGKGAWRTALAAAVLATQSQADCAFALQAGSYEVDVRLDLPNLQHAGAAQTVTLCLSGNLGEVYGLAVLTGNNPLARCPAVDIRRHGEVLTFSILCHERDGARATATYLLDPNGFTGRIEMTMGGKNMTMTERQEGRRIGPCACGREYP